MDVPGRQSAACGWRSGGEAPPRDIAKDTGGSPLRRADETGPTNTTGRLWKINYATTGRLNPAVRWDLPTGVTASVWPTTGAHAMPQDVTDKPPARPRASRGRGW